MSLEACSLVCPLGNSLWPLPRELSMSASLARIHPSLISKNVQAGKGAPDMIDGAIERQIELLSNKSSIASTPSADDLSLTVMVQMENNDETFNLDTDESYTLQIRKKDNIEAMINAPTYLGARHAVETLFQLMDFDRDNEIFWIVDSVNIEDRPFYSHRGFMVDTGHEFVPIIMIKKILDSLSYSKMNVFHWHLTDSQSFPFQLDFLSSVRSSSYSPSMYSKEDMKDIVEYAKERGILVLPEVEIPAHVGEWWQDIDPNLVLCMESTSCAMPPCGHLNPSEPLVYDLLENIYRELVEVFGDAYMHIGGNQIDRSCWDNSPAVGAWMNENGVHSWDYSAWRLFNEKAVAKLDKVSSGPPQLFLYTSQLTWPEYVGLLDKDRFTIQIWANSGSGNAIRAIAESGLKMVMSNADTTFLDCGFGTGIGFDNSDWCSYKDWKVAYQNDPREVLRLSGVADLETVSRNIAGGEATMMTKETDINSLMPKMEPRTAAYAETLWRSPGSTLHASEAESRMIRHRERLRERGILAQQITQRWCIHNPDMPCGEQ